MYEFYCFHMTEVIKGDLALTTEPITIELTDTLARDKTQSQATLMARQIIHDSLHPPEPPRDATEAARRIVIASLGPQS